MFYTTNELILRTKEKHTVFDIKTTYNRTQDILLRDIWEYPKISTVMIFGKTII